MSGWKPITVDCNHSKWNEVFSKVIKHQNVQVDSDVTKKEMTIQTSENVGRIQRKVKYKIVSEFIDDDLSILNFYQKKVE